MPDDQKPAKSLWSRIVVPFLVIGAGIIVLEYVSIFMMGGGSSQTFENAAKEVARPRSR